MWQHCKQMLYEIKDERKFKYFAPMQFCLIQRRFKITSRWQKSLRHLVANLNKMSTIKPVLSGPSKIDKTTTLMINGSLMKVESIAECSHWSILQYFWPALSNNRSWKPIFGLLFEWPLKTGFTVFHYAAVELLQWSRYDSIRLYNQHIIFELFVSRM